MEPPKTKHFEDFLKWAAEKGAIFPKIEIRYYSPNFRGVHATAPIAKGERIVTVPQLLILTESSGWTNSSLGAKIKAAGVPIDYPYCTFIGCLLFDAAKDATHFMRPYYDIFPSGADTFPFMFEGEDWEELKELSIFGIFLVGSTRERKNIRKIRDGEQRGDSMDK